MPPSNSGGGDGTRASTLTSAGSGPTLIPAAPLAQPGTEFPSFARPSAVPGPVAPPSVHVEGVQGNGEEHATKFIAERYRLAKSFSDHTLGLPGRVIDSVAMNRFLCSYREINKQIRQGPVAPTDTAATPSDTANDPPADAAPALQPVVPAQPPTATQPGSFTGFSFFTAPPAAPATAPVAFSFPIVPATNAAEPAALAASSSPAGEDADHDAAAQDDDDGPSHPPGGESADAAEWEVLYTVKAKISKMSKVSDTSDDKRFKSFCTSDLKLEQSRADPSIRRMIMRDGATLKVVFNMSIGRGMSFAKETVSRPNTKIKSIHFLGINGGDGSKPCDASSVEQFALSVGVANWDTLYSKLVAMVPPPEK